MVVANHAMGLYELAAIHLSERPRSGRRPAWPSTPWATWSKVLPGRLGEDEATLNDALTQLRMAFVQLNGQAADGAAAEPTS